MVLMAVKVMYLQGLVSTVFSMSEMIAGEERRESERRATVRKRKRKRKKSKGNSIADYIRCQQVERVMEAPVNRRSNQSRLELVNSDMTVRCLEGLLEDSAEGI